ncbi:MAG: TRAP transporter permease [Alphaproteobacteria bacterium]
MTSHPAPASEHGGGAGSGRVARLLRELSDLPTANGAVGLAAAAAALLVALSMAAIHLVQIWGFVLPSGQFKNVHLGFGLTLCALVMIAKAPAGRRVDRALLGVALAAVLVSFVFIHVEYEELVTTRTFLAQPSDFWIGVTLLLAALYICGREWGWTIPALAVAALAYGYWGNLIPGELFWHGGLRLERLIGYASIPYFQGLLGGLTELSAGTIFIFMLFAGILQVTGGIEFIIAIGRALGGRSRAGPAQVAVISSGFMGMISGSSVANVAATGAFTIPMMKRSGFKPEFAGAVEAVASTGGQLTPPVMGLAAFLIVGTTGIPYAEVMLAAAFPAFIYYVHLMLAVHLRTVALGIDTRTIAAASPGLEDVPIGVALWRYGHLLLGIAVLVTLLIQQMPAGTAALYSIGALLALDGTRRLLAGYRDPLGALAGILRMVVAGFNTGARGGAQVAVVIAVIGVMVEILAVTGFAQKLSNMMLDLADGRLWLLLLIAAFTCLVFGLGLPTSAAYIIVAVLGAPAMMKLGVPELAAHMFVFYFANVSAITPPVAVSALVAANIAGGRFMTTAFTSMQLGLPGFLLPFLFVVHPEILGIGVGAGTQALVAAIALIAVLSLNVAIEGHLVRPMRIWERALLLPAAFGLLYPGWTTTAVGLVLLLAVAAFQALPERRTATGLR